MTKNGKILITGASGMIGRRLISLLGAEGWEIHTLGRSVGTEVQPGVRHFVWDIGAQTMDSAALAGVDTIIHLAGAGVADSRWTSKRKEEIMSSRVLSSHLLFKCLQENTHSVKQVISASAVGYYGDRGTEWLSETAAAADTFLARVCVDWEEGVSRMSALGLRTVCCRIGIVLAAAGGALPELTRSLAWGVGGYFAKSPLYYPWIHIDDVCGIMMHAIGNDMQGPYNTVAPNPMTIHDLMKAIMRAKGAHALLMPVPPLALKLALGEMADMLLSSQRCMVDKVLAAGYLYKYGDVDSALRAIYPAANQ